MKDWNKKFLMIVAAVILVILGVWWVTIEEGQRLLNKDHGGDVVYEGNTEDRPSR